MIPCEYDLNVGWKLNTHTTQIHPDDLQTKPCIGHQPMYEVLRIQDLPVQLCLGQMKDKCVLGNGSENFR